MQELEFTSESACLVGLSLDWVVERFQRYSSFWKHIGYYNEKNLFCQMKFFSPFLLIMPRNMLSNAIFQRELFIFIHPFWKQSVKIDMHGKGRLFFEQIENFKMEVSKFW